MNIIERIMPPVFVGGPLSSGRVDTPDRNAGIPHFGDSTFFRMNPKRKTAVRAAYPQEFDQLVPAEVRAELPKMHVLVTKLSEGVHLVLPVYRTNRPFWTEPKSDAEAAVTVEAMARMGGWDLAEMQAFAAKYCTDDLVSPTVH
ncbi:hypothetical protein Terro_1144 [Terriglobus roseus DSM 18391]|uniref:Uncharacterized protein n=1 Tax=Terriglobus roseus (strain DSM 18391 / NRRL B-41598 / KBS 63) TaxID=926566 RepID=I3ZDZ4_TERRK|nr:hypothetical protein [Terriglobus roseus]AFL87462.1 hypothetical protein Terro_1144 [Terriglobus roseus DSM 18391]